MNVQRRRHDASKDHEENAQSIHQRTQARSCSDASGGHEPAAILKHLDLPRKNLIYKWKQEQLQDAGPVADSMDARLRELQAQLHRVERERDILKKALGILGRSD